MRLSSKDRAAGNVIWNNVLCAIPFIVGVNNASLKPQKAKTIGTKTVILGFKQLKSIIYCQVQAKAKDGLPPFFALIIDHVGCEILI